MYSRLSRKVLLGATAIISVSVGGSYLQTRYSPVWQQVKLTNFSDESVIVDKNKWNKFYLTAACASPASPVLVPSTERVSGTDFEPGVKLKMFQYITCPFCCKLRAYLDYHGIAYEIVEVNSVTRAQLNKEWSGPSRKVPILVLYPSNTQEVPSEPEYVTLHDSSVIISILESHRLSHKRKNGHTTENWQELRRKIEQLEDYYPRKPDSTEEKPVFANRYQLMFEKPLTDKVEYESRKHESQWRKWVDKVFVHTISPNLYRTISESLQTFRVFSKRGRWEEIFSPWEVNLVVYLGGAVMYFVSKKLKRKYELKDDVRESLYDAANVWTTELGEKSFVGGDKPHLGDLVMYGVMTSMDGCTALTDVENHNPKLKTWMERMRKLVPHNTKCSHCVH